MSDAGPFPQHLTIDVHNYCNARCGYCPYERLAASPEYAQGVMDRGVLVALLDECHDHREHIESMRFGNIAESLLLDEIWDAMAMALARDLPLYIDSNMTHFNVEAMERLDQWGFAGKVYAHVQPGMGVDEVCQQTNYEQAKARWGSERVELVQITDPRRWAGDPTIPTRKAQRCTADRPDTTMIIGWDGRVQLCCVDAEQRQIVGDVSASTIAAVWTGYRFTEARQQLAEGSNALCNRCEWGEPDGEA